MFDYPAVVSDFTSIARRAGEIILAQYDRQRGETVTDAFPTTAIDRAANASIVEALEALYPAIPILSEESADDSNRLSSPHIFIVDPLDGTKDYVNHTGDFSVLLALCIDGQPVVSVVYKPVDDVVYSAIAGQGAFRERNAVREQLSVDVGDDRSAMSLLVSKYHLRDPELQLQTAVGIGHRVAMGSAGLKMACIAEGNAHLYINTADKTGEWDSAAGVLLLQEAGGVVSDVEGNPLLFNKEVPKNVRGFVAASSTRLHADAIAELATILLH